jgi:hypothetical protein
VEHHKKTSAAGRRPILNRDSRGCFLIGKTGQALPKEFKSIYRQGYRRNLLVAMGQDTIKNDVASIMMNLHSSQYFFIIKAQPGEGKRSWRKNIFLP